MQILAPEAVYFDLIENGEGCIELWAATGLRCFTTTLSGMTVFFESTGQERNFGGKRMLRGFRSKPMPQLQRSDREIKDSQYLCPEVCLTASLVRLPVNSEWFREVSLLNFQKG